MSRVAALVVILIAITALVIWAAGGSLTWNAETTPAVIGNLLIVVVLLASLVMHWRGSLTEVRVGSIVRRNIRASVQQNLTDSLLGLSFLDQLSKYSSTADEMVLED
ncbi:MAG: hypothetical protein ABL996_21200 [Micropepsaceae bacterium]